MLLLLTALPLVAAERPGAATVRKVAILGDVFADALAEGMQADLADWPNATAATAARSPYGLADETRFDWAAAVHTLLAGPPPDAAVIMLGAHDMTPLPDGAAIAQPHGERWRQIYGERVQAIADLFRAGSVPLIWVGLPVVADESVSAGFVEINSIFRERATMAGATYLDVWNDFTDEAGRYNASGPDANGRTTRLRTADGAGFTRAGAIKLASFVDAELRRRRPAPPSDPVEAGMPLVLPRQPGFDAVPTIDDAAQIHREAGVSAKIPPIADKAVSGPVIILTSPVLAPDGRLVPPVGDAAPASGATAAPARRTLTESRPSPPKPGRIGDFSWPPH